MKDYLENLIRGEFPVRRGARVANVAEIEGGWERSTYAFDLSREGLSHFEPMVARFYQGPSGDRRAAWEASVLQALARAGVPVPRVELVSAKSRYGTGVVIMERLPGVALTEALRDGVALAADMARALVALHRVPTNAVFNNSLQPFTEPEFIAPDLKAITSAVERFGLIEFRPLIELLDASAPDDNRPCILHNDYTPENILISADADLAIIDWSFAGVGDYRLDLAWSALWTEARAGSRARAEFLRAYEEDAGHPIERLEHFEALRFGARLMTIVGWMNDAIEFPALKVTKDVIYGDYKPTVLTVYDRFGEVTDLRLPSIEQL